MKNSNEWSEVIEDLKQLEDQLSDDQRDETITVKLSNQLNEYRSKVSYIRYEIEELLRNEN